MIMHNIRHLLLLLTLASTVSPSLAEDVKESPKREGAKPTVEIRPKSATVPSEMEALALALAKEHLPALQSVLERLRSDSPAQYKNAIRDIAKSAKRLETVRARDPRLHSLELNLLKAKTSASLTVARLKVRDSVPDRDALKAAITELRQAEVERAAYEVELLQTRLQRTREQLEEAESRLLQKTNNSSKDLDATYHELLRKAGRASAKQDAGTRE